MQRRSQSVSEQTFHLARCLLTIAAVNYYADPFAVRELLTPSDPQVGIPQLVLGRHVPLSQTLVVRYVFRELLARHHSPLLDRTSLRPPGGRRLACLA